MQNVRRFQADLKKLAEKANLALGVVVTKIAMDAWEGLTMRTPVDTGRARASWTIKEGSPSDTVPAGGDYGAPSPPEAVFEGDESIFITSGLDYIQYLEDGSSSQAPTGMVLVTLAELEAEAANVINQIP